LDHIWVIYETQGGGYAHTNNSARASKDLKLEETKQAIQDLTKIYDKIDIFSTREITEETTNIALTQNTTIYDALYITATQKLNATLYTADQLNNIAKKITNTKLLRP
jgi:predicted nucleic acid-binding protein